MSDDEFVSKLVAWDDVKAEMDAREARHEARVWPWRKTIDAYRWVRYTCRTLYRRPPWYHVKWFVQRGRRGWADCDVWSLDSYLERVLAGSLRQLRDVSLTWPGPIPGGDTRFESPEQWQAFLTRIAEALSKDQFRLVEGETIEQQIARETAEYEAKQQAIRDLADWWGSLWD